MKVKEAQKQLRLPVFALRTSQAGSETNRCSAPLAGNFFFFLCLNKEALLQSQPSATYITDLARANGGADAPPKANNNKSNKVSSG